MISHDINVHHALVYLVYLAGILELQAIHNRRKTESKIIQVS